MGRALALVWGRGGVEKKAYVKLPALDVLACVLVGDDDDELGDLAADHPFVELGHDFLDVGLDLVVGRDCNVLDTRYFGGGFGVGEGIRTEHV